MSLLTTNELSPDKGIILDPSKISQNLFSKDYVDFLKEAGWRLEKIYPSNRDNYSDLLEDTEWKSNEISFNSLKHYRRDLDALS